MENAIIEVKFNKLEKYKSEIAQMVTDISYDITAPETMRRAADDMKLGKGFIKQIDDERKNILSPMAELTNQTNNDVRNMVQPFAKALDKLAQSYTSYVRLEEEKEAKLIKEAREAEAKRIAAEAEKKVTEVVSVAAALNNPGLVDQGLAIQQEAQQTISALNNAPVDVKITTRGAVGSASYRDNWSAEIIDKKQALEYLIFQGWYELIEINTKGLVGRMGKEEKVEKGIKICNKKVLVSR
jgi:hypothetical protein